MWGTRRGEHSRGGRTDSEGLRLRPWKWRLLGESVGR